MTRRVGGFRRKTRSKLRKRSGTRGKISIRKYLQKFNVGDRVCLKAEPAVQHGMYFPRFHGKHGKIVGKQGKCYIVGIKDKLKEKELIVHPVHLSKV